MKIRWFIFPMLLALGNGIVHGAVPVYDFAGLPPERFQDCFAYGNDCKLSQEDDTLTARFTDRTSIEWCNQGFGINLPTPVAWDEFSSVELDYRRTAPLNAIGVLLFDTQGNVFFAFQSRDLNQSERNRAYFSGDEFHFSCNESDPDRKDAPKTYPLRKMIVYGTTGQINTGTNYRFQFDRVAFLPPVSAPARALEPDTMTAAPFGEIGKPDQLLGDTVRVERDGDAFRIHFDDTAPGSDWFHKGVKLTLPEPVKWEDFNFLTFDYQMEPGFVTVGVYLRDADQVWHEAFQSRGLVTGKWGNAVFEKEAFHPGEFNRSPNPAAGGRQAPIEEVFLYSGSITANQGKSYDTAVRNLTFSQNLPGYDYQYEIVADFPAQWRNDRVDARGFLEVDGKPFFPLVLYSCIGIDRASATSPISLFAGEVDDTVNRRRFQEVRDAGFNTLMTYTLNLYGQPVSEHWNGDRSGFPGEDGETTEELYREGARHFLDCCQAAGLHAMIGAYSSYTVPKALPSTGKKLRWEENKARLQRNIAALKDHPALLTWYMIDEPSSLPLPVRDLIQTYQYVKQLDTEHPFLMAAADPRRDSEYFPGVDIVAPDSYPLAFDKPILTDWNNLGGYAQHQQGAPGYPLLWQIVQICQWIDGKELPSAQLIRLQCLLALTREVKGLCFYEHKNYPEREPVQWAEISRAVNSLHRILPAILASPGVGTAYHVNRPELKTILYRGMEFDLLIAANPSAEPVDAEFSFAEFTPVGVVAIDENAAGEFTPEKERDLHVHDRTFDDTIPALTGRAYRIYHATIQH